MVHLLEKTYPNQRFSINEMICGSSDDDGKNDKRLFEKLPVLKNPTYNLCDVF